MSEYTIYDPQHVCAHCGRLRQHEEEITRLTRERDEAVQKAKELEKLVYVPGLWKCAKCKFSLMQCNLNAVDGTVTARDQPGDKCPNCNGPLWRVTERQAGNEMIDLADAAIQREKALEKERDEAIAAYVQALDRAGYVIVPKEPTPEMEVAEYPDDSGSIIKGECVDGYLDGWGARDVYITMLAARPKPPFIEG